MKEWRTFDIEYDIFKEKLGIPKKCKIVKIRYDKELESGIRIETAVNKAVE